MASEQGAGGGIESNRRQMSTSENEPIPDAEQQNTNLSLDSSQQQKDDTQFTQPQQGLPRNFDPPSSTSTPSTAGIAMSRALSNGSNAGTPTPQTEGGYFSVNYHRSKPQQQPSLPLEPPVTRTTLGELDVAKIIHNPKLRHDINFDPELHFRPNVDGDKGKRKEAKAEHFWKTLHDQLVLFIMDRDAFHRTYGTGDGWCLPQLLRTVKDIIQTLVPTKDRGYLDDGLNLELLMQQFNKGIVDLEKLASWLSTVLKSHCAPMRDEWVDKMYERLSNGNRNNDIAELVQGMKSLLEVLEAMKLDVANHQIRCLRPVLIEDTVHFEQRFFTKRIQSGRIDISCPQQWYRQAEQRYADATMRSPAAVHSFGDMAVFFEAFANLVRPSTPDKEVPSTLYYDEERFMKMRSDMYDAIGLEVCMRLYDDLDRVGRSVNSFLSGSSGSPIDTESATSRSSSPFAFDFNTRPSSGSRPSSLAFSNPDSISSSPRSSLVFPNQAFATSDSTEAKAKARELYNSLVAILQSAPPTSSHEQRWTLLAPALALQIFRYTNAPSDMLRHFEAKLSSHFPDDKSANKTFTALFREVEEHFNERLMMELQRRVREFRGLTGVALFSVATGGRLQGAAKPWESRDHRAVSDGAARDSREDGGIEDLAIRMAHLGILHWRVWADLVYVGEGGSARTTMPAPGQVHN